MCIGNATRCPTSRSAPPTAEAADAARLGFHASPILGIAIVCPVGPIVAFDPDRVTVSSTLLPRLEIEAVKAVDCARSTHEHSTTEVVDLVAARTYAAVSTMRASTMRSTPWTERRRPTACADRRPGEANMADQSENMKV